MDRVYAAIDLKSFYASVECVSRGLDPLSARLVVADESRTEKTICLAVSPALKKYGLSGRSRLFEVMAVAQRERERAGTPFEYIIAPPRMKKYMAVSADIYEKVYLKYLAPEDLHAYSIDEVFLDLTKYLPLYRLSPFDMVKKLMEEIRLLTGITATAGIGPNLYLCKVAMDILAKHREAEKGIPIAEMTEQDYREQLWDHRPLTDFWRVGRQTMKRLEGMRIYTMGDIARRSLTNEDSLYKEFGVDAELLIDHAWGQETCTMEDIHSYTAQSHSLTAGQVMARPYAFDEARLVLREMADGLALQLASKKLKTDSVTLTVNFDREKLDAGEWKGPVQKDFYGRTVPKAAHGSQHITDAGGAHIFTAAGSRLMEAAASIFDRTCPRDLTVRRLTLAVNNVRPETEQRARQMDLFTSPETLEKEDEKLRREEKVQQVMLNIKQKYGKNAILKGFNYLEGATARERNAQVGGHRAGQEDDDDASV